MQIMFKEHRPVGHFSDYNFKNAFSVSNGQFHEFFLELLVHEPPEGSIGTILGSKAHSDI